MSLRFIREGSKKHGSVDRGLLEVSCQVEIDLDSVADACLPACPGLLDEVLRTTSQNEVRHLVVGSCRPASFRRCAVPRQMPDPRRSWRDPRDGRRRTGTAAREQRGGSCLQNTLCSAASAREFARKPSSEQLDLWCRTSWQNGPDLPGFSDPTLPYAPTAIVSGCEGPHPRARLRKRFRKM